MKAKTTIHFLTTFLVLVGLSSCYTTKKAYVGRIQRKASLATIKGTRVSSKANEFTCLYSVDSIPVMKPYDLSYRYVLCEIIPGPHTIEIADFQNESQWTLLTGRYLVSFDAEAGKTYIIESVTDQATSTVDVFVTEEKSGKRVPSTVDYYYHLKESDE